jgi:membrane protein implicated in regulation of membrane protease activity
MDKLGFLAILAGILMLIGYWLYIMLIEISLPFFIKIAIILIVVGIVFVLFKQLFDRRKEKEEMKDYKDY